MTDLGLTEDIEFFIDFLNGFEGLETLNLRPFEGSNSELKYAILTAGFKKSEDLCLYAVKIVFDNKGDYSVGYTLINEQITPCSGSLSFSELRDKIKSEQTLVKLIN